MTSPTEQVVEQALAQQDADEANDKGAQDDKKQDQAADAAAGKPGAGDDAKKPADAVADKPKYDEHGMRIKDEDAKVTDDKDDKTKADDKKDEGEFTADDALEVDAKKEDKTEPAVTDNAGIQLSPAEQKYIADNIGEPLVIKGFVGEGENAKEIEIKAYSPNDIPANFKFANDQQLVATQNGFMRLETKANQLLGNFRQNQSNTAAQDFERRENEGIKADVADLQKEGKFPKFKVKPGEAGFDDDPAAKQMTEVLAIMTKRNQTYLDQYNQGRPYKHIGFAEAFDIWEKTNPERQALKEADKNQNKEDKERKQVAERGPSNRSTNSTNIVKPTVKPGTSTRELLNRIDNDDSLQG